MEERPGRSKSSEMRCIGGTKVLLVKKYSPGIIIRQQPPEMPKTKEKKCLIEKIVDISRSPSLTEIEEPIAELTDKPVVIEVEPQSTTPQVVLKKDTQSMRRIGGGALLTAAAAGAVLWWYAKND